MNNQTILPILENCLADARKRESEAFSSLRSLRSLAEGRGVEHGQAEAFWREKIALAATAKADFDTLKSYYDREGQPPELSAQLSRLENEWKVAESTAANFKKKAEELQSQSERAQVPVAEQQQVAQRLRAEREKIKARIGEIKQAEVRRLLERNQPPLQAA